MLHIEFKIGRKTLELWDIQSFQYTVNGHLLVVFFHNQDTEISQKIYMSWNKHAKVISSFVQSGSINTYENDSVSGIGCNSAILDKYFC